MKQQADIRALGWVNGPARKSRSEYGKSVELADVLVRSGWSVRPVEDGYAVTKDAISAWTSSLSPELAARLLRLSAVVEEVVARTP